MLYLLTFCVVRCMLMRFMFPRCPHRKKPKMLFRFWYNWIVAVCYRCCIECFESFPFLALTNSLWINSINSSAPCSIYFRDACHNIPFYFKNLCSLSIPLIWFCFNDTYQRCNLAHCHCVWTFQEPKFNWILSHNLCLCSFFFRNEWEKRRESVYNAYYWKCTAYLLHI